MSFDWKNVPRTEFLPKVAENAIKQATSKDPSLEQNLPPGEEPVNINESISREVRTSDEWFLAQLTDMTARWANLLNRFQRAISRLERVTGRAEKLSKKENFFFRGELRDE